MAIYFLLGTLTTEGQTMIADDPDTPEPYQHSSENDLPGARMLGQYAVLGHYDMLAMVEADSNADVARLSATLGARTGMRFETLSAVNMTTADVPAMAAAEPDPENAARTR